MSRDKIITTQRRGLNYFFSLTWKQNDKVTLTCRGCRSLLLTEVIKITEGRQQMIIDKMLQAKYDVMSRTELKKVEQDLLDTRDLVTLTYIKKRMELVDAEPTRTRRNTILALTLVTTLSALLIAAAFIVPAVSAWLRT